MAIRQGGARQQHIVYTHMSTTNQSFLNMHYYLKDKGIKNNTFHLALLDKDLAGIDPRDPRLNEYMKRKVLRECINNFWYFIREVVRIPDQGGDVNSGVKYELHRGNLALNFGFVRNWNMFLELPRQNFKTISAICRYLWSFNFGTTNSEIMFINKKHDDSKENLSRLKDIRAALPSYLRMESGWGMDGKKLKPTDKAESLGHPINGNSVKTLPGARNRINANSLGRGLTQPIQWYDEYAFIPFIGIIYQSATPAFQTASLNAKRNNSPYGILITTTPGDLTTEEGLDAYKTKEDATAFTENMYDMSMEELNNLLSKNTYSSFVYMRFTYEQLGRDEEWFKNICVYLKRNWSAIRREILLEWSRASDNSPFTKEDLNIVRGMIMPDPLYQVTLCNYFQMNVYKRINLTYPPIIGVDVSGGFKRDASAISIIDSRTTELVATFNNNYISPDDLALVIYELVTKYMPNAVVIIERTGGYGSSVVGKLMKTDIRHNLYYEIKDKIIEETYSNGRIKPTTQRTKVYGFDTTGTSRDNLMEILRERMNHHKDKFICPNLFNELEGLEVKRNGRVEHSSNSRDDIVMSYLLALYVWYDGHNLKENFGIEKSSIRSDYELEGGIEALADQHQVIVEELGLMSPDDEDVVLQQLNFIDDKSITYSEFLEKERQNDMDSLQAILADRLGRETYAKKYHLDPELLNRNGGRTRIPDSIFTDFYEDIEQ